MGKLKPCPFCGSEADTSFNIQFGYQAFCTNDDCFLNYVIMLDMRTEEDAIDAWNRRANDEHD